MTVKDAADLIIVLGAIAGALLALGTLLWITVVKPLRRTLSDELTPVVSRLAKVEQGQASLDQRMSDHIMTHGTSPDRRLADSTLCSHTTTGCYCLPVRRAHR